MTYKPEADLNHIRHLDPNHRYACHNRKPIDRITYNFQEGWTRDGRKNMIKHDTRWLPLDGCGHSYSKTDPACTGCRWR